MHRLLLRQKQVLIIFLFGLMSATGFSQYVHKIKADSVKITNDSCNAELILENSTRHVQGGFLYNKGNGRTEFRKVTVKVNDSTYQLGDTLELSNNPILNQYVQKQTASAWFDSLKVIEATLISPSTEFPVLRIKDSLGRTALEMRSSFKGWSANTYIGLNAGRNSNPHTSAGYSEATNVAVGFNAGYSLTRGFKNTIVGASALASSSLGNFNTVLGNLAGSQLTAGEDNTILGQAAAYSKTGNGLNSGFYRNVIIGSNAFETAGVGGSSNVMVGVCAGLGITEGSGNVFIGDNAGRGMGSVLNNRLAITNITTTEPLIYGEFDNRRLVANGSFAVNDASALNLGMNKFYVNGSSKFAGNIAQTAGRMLLGNAIDDGTNNLQVNGSIKATSLISTQTIMPTSSADPSGQQGEIRADDNYIYFKTSTGWKRASLTTF